MGKRRKAREFSLQILFQLEFDSSHPEETASRFWEEKKPHKEERELSDWLVKGVITHKQQIDLLIQSVSQHWRISRMVLIDRNILRIATYELICGKDITPAIVINEAIEIAKKYSGNQSAVFINGILDALTQDLDNIKNSWNKEEVNE